MKKILILFTIILMLLNIAYATPIDEFIEGDNFLGKIIIPDGDYESASQFVKNMKSAKLYKVEEEQETEIISFKFEAPLNPLSSSETLDAVLPTITENEFPLLGSGYVTAGNDDYLYSQYINTFAGAYTTFEIADAIPDDEDKIPLGYLKFLENYPAYEYQIIFQKPLKSEIDASFNLADLEDTTIRMLGIKYMITDIDHDAKNSIEITLLSQSEEILIANGEKETIILDGEEYGIKFIGASKDSSYAKVMIGNVTETLELEDKYDFGDGVYMQVKGIYYLDETESMLGIVIYGKETIIKDDDVTDGTYSGIEYTFNKEDVDGTDVKIEGIDDGLVEGGEFKIKSISIKWTPDDDHFVGENTYLSEILEDKNQLFGKNFDIRFGGLNMDNDLESLSLSDSSDTEYTLTFTNTLGDEIELPLFYDNSGTFSRFGDSSTAVIGNEGTNISVGDYFIVTSDGYKNVTQASGYTQLLEYIGQNAAANTLSVKDIGTGKTHEFIYANAATTAKIIFNAVEYDVNISDTDDGNIKVDLNNDGSVDAGDMPVIVTQYKSNIDLIQTGANAFKQMIFYSAKKRDDLGGALLNAYLYGTIGPAVQAGLNAALGGFGVNITENPVTDSNAITEFHDSVRVTIEDDSGKIDIANLERCVEAATPYQIEASITNTAFDAVLVGALGQTLAQYTRDTFLDNVCYPTFTATQEFMISIGDTEDKQGSTSYASLWTLTDESNGPDRLDAISAKNEVEQLVYFEQASPQKGLDFLPKGDFNVYTDSVDLDKDLILIGGPCTNEITRKVMETEGDCTEGFEPETARVKIMYYEGKKALIIAGYSSEDTMMAVSAFFNNPNKFADGNDFVVSGNPSSPTVKKYVKKEKEELVLKEEEVLREPKIVEIYGEFDYELKKLGMKQTAKPLPTIRFSGLEGTISYLMEEPFKAMLGINTVQFTTHLLKGGCDGEEIWVHAFRWVDGDGTKTEEVTLPEEGKYCVKIENEDIAVEKADTKMITGDGAATFEFEAGFE